MPGLEAVAKERGDKDAEARWADKRRALEARRTNGLTPPRSTVECLLAVGEHECLCRCGHIE